VFFSKRIPKNFLKNPPPPLSGLWRKNFWVKIFIVFLEFSDKLKRSNFWEKKVFLKLLKIRPQQSGGATWTKKKNESHKHNQIHIEHTSNTYQTHLTSGKKRFFFPIRKKCFSAWKLKISWFWIGSENHIFERFAIVTAEKKCDIFPFGRRIPLLTSKIG